VFRKNLGVTNIQYGEMFALLRINARCDGADTGDREFISGGEFQALMDDLVNGFGEAVPDTQARAGLVAELYGPMLRRLVVVDALYGSCGVHFAPGISVDLAAVCAHVRQTDALPEESAAHLPRPAQTEHQIRTCDRGH
jgi:hypothetical protein